MKSWIVVDMRNFDDFDMRFNYNGSDVIFVSISEIGAVCFAKGMCGWTDPELRKDQHMLYGDEDTSRNGNTMYEFNNADGTIKVLVFAEEDIACCEAWLAYKLR